nr:hypothetical protein [Pseudomonadota bacterium]
MEAYAVSTGPQSTRTGRADAAADAPAGVAAAVRRILSQPDRALDHGAAKLAFDKLVDPSADVGAAMAELDRLAGIAAAMAGPPASEGAKLGAIRNLIYESGPWNGHRPFAYNH